MISLSKALISTDPSESTFAFVRGRSSRSIIIIMKTTRHVRAIEKAKCYFGGTPRDGIDVETRLEADDPQSVRSSCTREPRSLLEVTVRGLGCRRFEEMKEQYLDSPLEDACVVSDLNIRTCGRRRGSSTERYPDASARRDGTHLDDGVIAVGLFTSGSARDSGKTRKTEDLHVIIRVIWRCEEVHFDCWSMWSARAQEADSVEYLEEWNPFVSRKWARMNTIQIAALPSRFSKCARLRREPVFIILPVAK